MSDQRLRQLQRAWERSGDPAAGAAYLNARLQAGDLSRERRDLAAYLGHAPAILAGGAAGRYRDREAAIYPTPGLAKQLADHPQPALHPGNSAGLVVGLDRFPGAPLRAATAAAWLSLPVLDVGAGEAVARAAGEAFATLRSQSADEPPASGDPRALLDEALEQWGAEHFPGQDWGELEPPEVSWHPDWNDAVPDEARRHLPVAWSIETTHAFRALEAACEAAARHELQTPLSVTAVWEAAWATSYEAVLARVEAELIRWALAA